MFEGQTAHYHKQKKINAFIYLASKTLYLHYYKFNIFIITCIAPIKKICLNKQSKPYLASHWLTFRNQTFRDCIICLHKRICYLKFLSWKKGRGNVINMIIIKTINNSFVYT